MKIYTLTFSKNLKLCRSSICISSLDEVQDSGTKLILDLGFEKCDIKSISKSIIVTPRPEVLGIEVVKEILDEVKIGNNVLNTLLAVKELKGSTVLYSSSSYSVGIRKNNMIVLALQVLPISNLAPELIIDDLKILYSYLEKYLHDVNLDELVKKLSKLIIEERRNYKTSHTLKIIHEVVLGNLESIKKLPTHVLDLLLDYGVIDEELNVNLEKLRNIYKLILNHVYPE